MDWIKAVDGSACSMPLWLNAGVTARFTYFTYLSLIFIILWTDIVRYRNTASSCHANHNVYAWARKVTVTDTFGARLVTSRPQKRDQISGANNACTTTISPRPKFHTSRKRQLLQNTGSVWRGPDASDDIVTFQKAVRYSRLQLRILAMSLNWASDETYHRLVHENKSQNRQSSLCVHCRPLEYGNTEDVFPWDDLFPVVLRDGFVIHRCWSCS
jgi:hypothetical protein